MLLFIAGATPFLAGIVYSTIYPSHDAHVVANLVIGGVLLVAFGLWENLGEKKGWVKHPLTPTRVFTAGYGRELTAPCVAVAIINTFYYGTSIIWPTAIATFWIDSPTDWRGASILSLVQGFAITTGVIFLSLFGSTIKRWNWQMTGYCFVMVLFGSLLALISPDRKAMMIVFVFLSQAGYSAAIYLAIAISQLGVEQKDLGISGGLSGTIRFAGGAIATAVYTAVFTNTVATWSKKLVPAAAEAAGLPATDLPSLFKVLGTPALAENFSTNVVSAVTAATSKATQKGLQ